MSFTDVSIVPQYKTRPDFESNTNISLRNGYVYFAVDKVANSSIKNTLYGIEFEPVGWQAPTLYDKRCSPLLSPYQLPDTLLREVLNSGNYYRFAFVRNPYARLLSCYLDRICTVKSRPRRQLNKYLRSLGRDPQSVDFSVFIRAICEQPSPQQNSHWRSQTDDILYPCIEFDFIGRFEQLWDGMETVSQALWGTVIPEMQARDLNKSPKATNATQKLREYYTPELADLVYDRYASDFENFGYSRDWEA